MQALQCRRAPVSPSSHIDPSIRRPICHRVAADQDHALTGGNSNHHTFQLPRAHAPVKSPSPIQRRSSMKYARPPGLRRSRARSCVSSRSSTAIGQVLDIHADRRRPSLPSKKQAAEPAVVMRNRSRISPGPHDGCKLPAVAAESCVSNGDCSVVCYSRGARRTSGLGAPLASPSSR